MEQKRVAIVRRTGKKRVQATAASMVTAVTNEKTMKKRWRKIGFYIMELVRRRRWRRVEKKESERKRGRTKIIACKHSEIKHDSIMILYIDMKQNKNQVAREWKRRNNERNMNDQSVAQSFVFRFTKNRRKVLGVARFCFCFLWSTVSTLVFVSAMKMRETLWRFFVFRQELLRCVSLSCADSYYTHTLRRLSSIESWKYAMQEITMLNSDAFCFNFILFNIQM